MIVVDTSVVVRYLVGTPLSQARRAAALIDDEATEMGPLISAGQRDTALSYVAIGLEEGARKVAGGDVPDRPGFFLRPTVLADVDNGWRVARRDPRSAACCSNTEKRDHDDAAFALA